MKHCAATQEIHQNSGRLGAGSVIFMPISAIARFHEFHDFHYFRSCGWTLTPNFLIRIYGSWACACTKIHMLSQFWPNDIQIHRLDPEQWPNNRWKFTNSLVMGFPELVANGRRKVLLREAALLKGSRLYKPCSNETLRGSAENSPKPRPNGSRIPDFQANFRDYAISLNFAFFIIFAHVTGP